MLGEHASSGGERRTKAGSERSQSVKKLSAQFHRGGGDASLSFFFESAFVVNSTNPMVSCERSVVAVSFLYVCSSYEHTRG